MLRAAQRVVLAVDADGPGVVLADELARRIGREKCWRVTWPTGPHDSLHPDAPAAAAAAAAELSAAADTTMAGLPVDTATASPSPQPPAADVAAAAAAAMSVWARKDANEVLVKDGPQVLLAYLDAAQPLPIRGLFRFEDFWPQASKAAQTTHSTLIQTPSPCAAVVGLTLACPALRACHTAPLPRPPAATNAAAAVWLTLHVAPSPNNSHGTLPPPPSPSPSPISTNTHNQVYDLYSQGVRGLSWGVSTGWPSVDALYKVCIREQATRGRRGGDCVASPPCPSPLTAAWAQRAHAHTQSPTPHRLPSTATQPGAAAAAPRCLD